MVLAALLARIAVCHRADPSAFEPWFVDGVAVGRIHRERVPLVERAPTPLRRDDGRLVLPGADYRARTDAFAALAQRLPMSTEHMLDELAARSRCRWCA